MFLSNLGRLKNFTPLLIFVIATATLGLLLIPIDPKQEELLFVCFGDNSDRVLIVSYLGEMERELDSSLFHAIEEVWSSQTNPACLAFVHADPKNEKETVEALAEKYGANGHYSVKPYVHEDKYTPEHASFNPPLKNGWILLNSFASHPELKRANGLFPGMLEGGDHFGIVPKDPKLVAHWILANYNLGRDNEFALAQLDKVFPRNKSNLVKLQDYSLRTSDKTDRERMQATNLLIGWSLLDLKVLALMDLERWDLAREYCNLAQECISFFPDWSFYLAMIHVQLNERERAVTYLAQAQDEVDGMVGKENRIYYPLTKKIISIRLFLDQDLIRDAMEEAEKKRLWEKCVEMTRRRLKELKVQE